MYQPEFAGILDKMRIPDIGQVKATVGRTIPALEVQYSMKANWESPWGVSSSPSWPLLQVSQDPT